MANTLPVISSSSSERIRTHGVKLKAFGGRPRARARARVCNLTEPLKQTKRRARTTPTDPKIPSDD